MYFLTRDEANLSFDESGDLEFYRAAVSQRDEKFVQRLLGLLRR